MSGEMRIAALAAGLALALAAAGCGGGDRTPAAASAADAEQMYLAAVDSIVTALDTAVGYVSNAGSDRAAAAHALADDDVLYAALVGYTDLGGCGKTLSLAGLPTARLRPLRAQLAAACVEFERASTLFEQAVARDSPRLLAAASRRTLAGAALLYRARNLREALAPA
jgi:hypothetical protein